MFEDPDTRARAAIAAVWAWLAADALVAASSMVTVAALGGLGGFHPSPETADRISPVAGLLFLAALAVSVVFVARWMVLVSRNAHRASAGLTISPGWAVGWYFIPFANLVKPFTAMREIWQASSDPADPSRVAVPGLLRWWWGLWLATSVLGNASARLSASGTAGGLIAGGWVDLVSLAVDVPLAITLVRLIRELGAIQKSNIQYAATFA